MATHFSANQVCYLPILRNIAYKNSESDRNTETETVKENQTNK